MIIMWIWMRKAAAHISGRVVKYPAIETATDWNSTRLLILHARRPSFIFSHPPHVRVLLSSSSSAILFDWEVDIPHVSITRSNLCRPELHTRDWSIGRQTKYVSSEPIFETWNAHNRCNLISFKRNQTEIRFESNVGRWGGNSCAARQDWPLIGYMTHCCQMYFRPNFARCAGIAFVQGCRTAINICQSHSIFFCNPFLSSFPNGNEIVARFVIVNQVTRSNSSQKKMGNTHNLSLYQNVPRRSQLKAGIQSPLDSIKKKIPIHNFLAFPFRRETEIIDNSIPRHQY